MPRIISTDLQTIFDGFAMDADYLLDVTFPTLDALRIATAPIQKSAIDYNNDISAVGEVRRTLLGQILDTVTVTIEDKFETYKYHYSQNPLEWVRAEAVLYRRFYNADKTLSVDVEEFRGGVESPQTDDEAGYVMTIQIVPDTKSTGKIVANRTLADPCQFIFKHPRTCAYAGSGTSCNHLLKGDCTLYANTHHFGGMQAYASPIPTPPGAGGDDRFEPHCPEENQFIKTRRGVIRAKEVTTVDELYNPLSKQFERVKEAVRCEGEPLFETVTQAGAIALSSATHPLITAFDDPRGTSVRALKRGGAVLTFDGIDTVTASTIKSITPKGAGAVIKIETFGAGHIYAAGSSVKSFVVCHNRKDNDILLY